MTFFPPLAGLVLLEKRFFFVLFWEGWVILAV